MNIPVYIPQSHALYTILPSIAEKMARAIVTESLKSFATFEPTEDIVNNLIKEQSDILIKRLASTGYSMTDSLIDEIAFSMYDRATV